MHLNSDGYRLANGIDGATVLDRLGARRSRTRRKYACIVCTSSDALHAWPKGGARCFSCATSWTNIDLVMTVQKCTPREALDSVAGMLGLTFSGSVRARNAQPRSRLVVKGREVLSSAWTELSRLRAIGLVPSPPEEIYRELLDGARLGRIARGYLEDRAIDAYRAEHQFGLVSIESCEDFDEICRRLGNCFLLSELAAAGLAVCESCVQTQGESGHAKLGYRRGVPCLLIPFRCGGNEVAIRFRSLSSTVKPKYLELSGARPIIDPWNVDALENCASTEVHITEGELDALTLAVRGFRAVGVPGASARMELIGRLASSVGDAARVIVWKDADANGAGAGAVKRIVTALTDRHGAEWTRTHVIVRTPANGLKDANDVARAGAL